MAASESTIDRRSTRHNELLGFKGLNMAAIQQAEGLLFFPCFAIAILSVRLPEGLKTGNLRRAPIPNDLHLVEVDSAIFCILSRPLGMR